MILLRKLKMLALGGALLASLVAPQVGAAELKVGVVNASEVMEKAPQAEAARNKLEKEFQPRNDELVAMQKELKQMQDKLARDGAVMSEEERRKLELDIRSSGRDLKRSQDEFRDDLNIRRNEELAKIQRQISETIQALARDQGFDIILTNATVLYSSKRLDITEQVVQRLKSAR